MPASICVQVREKRKRSGESAISIATAQALRSACCFTTLHLRVATAYLSDLAIGVDKHIAGAKIALIIFLHFTVFGYVWLSAQQMMSALRAILPAIHQIAKHPGRDNVKLR